jgi:hypothetical protein
MISELPGTAFEYLARMPSLACVVCSGSKMSCLFSGCAARIGRQHMCVECCSRRAVRKDLTPLFIRSTFLSNCLWSPWMQRLCLHHTASKMDVRRRLWIKLQGSLFEHSPERTLALSLPLRATNCVRLAEVTSQLALPWPRCRSLYPFIVEHRQMAAKFQTLSRQKHVSRTQGISGYVASHCGTAAGYELRELLY